MHTKLSVEIVTHGGVAYQGEADGLVAPGVSGYFGLLPRHAPLIAELGVGALRLRESNQWHRFALAGGILHMRDGAVVIMADAVERADEIDRERAQSAADRARERLAAKQSETDLKRAEAALLRAVNRLRVVGKE